MQNRLDKISYQLSEECIQALDIGYDKIEDSMTDAEYGIGCYDYYVNVETKQDFIPFFNSHFNVQQLLKENFFSIREHFPSGGVCLSSEKAPYLIKYVNGMYDSLKGKEMRNIDRPLIWQKCNIKDTFLVTDEIFVTSRYMNDFYKWKTVTNSKTHDNKIQLTSKIMYDDNVLVEYSNESDELQLHECYDSFKNNRFLVSLLLENSFNNLDKHTDFFLGLALLIAQSKSIIPYAAYPFDIINPPDKEDEDKFYWSNTGCFINKKNIDSNSTMRYNFDRILDKIK